MLKRVMVFGTFDILHQGHKNFFKQARKLSNNVFLIVSVARDLNVKKIKGKKPLYNELERLDFVKKTGLANIVVLGSKNSFLAHIVECKPHVIALGYDQVAYTQNLEKKLLQKGLKVKIVKLKPFKPNVYKSSLLKKSKT